MKYVISQSSPLSYNNYGFLLVSFECAYLLRLIGFDWVCDFFYSENVTQSIESVTPFKKGWVELYPFGSNYMYPYENEFEFNNNLNKYVGHITLNYQQGVYNGCFEKSDYVNYAVPSLEYLRKFLRDERNIDIHIVSHQLANLNKYYFIEIRFWNNEPPKDYLSLKSAFKNHDAALFYALDQIVKSEANNKSNK